MDSLGPLIGPVVPPAETTRPMRVRSERVSSSSNRLGPSSLLSFGADARTTSCMALVTRALSTLSSAVLRCWCLTGPQQPPIGGCESLSLPLLVGKRVGDREGGFGNTVDRCWYCSFPRNHLAGWKFVYGNAMIEIRKGIVLLRVNIWEDLHVIEGSSCIVFYLWRGCDEFFQ